MTPITEGTTALAIIEDNNHSSTYSPVEMRARSIMSRLESVSAKLKTLEEDVRLLWIDFDNLKTGETILGCATKKEFCEKCLNRTYRAVHYMLEGGNTSRPVPSTSENVSLPPEPAPTTVVQLPDGSKITVRVNDYISVQRFASPNDKVQRKGAWVVNERVVSVTGGRCDPRLYFVVVENKTFDKNHFDSNGVDYCGTARILGFTVAGVEPKPLLSNMPLGFQEYAAAHPDVFLAAKFDDAPEPVTNHDTEIEDAILALPDLPELDEAVKNPITHPAINQFQPKKPDAKTESQLKKMQREWAAVTNPAIGRITVTASNVGSDVETAAGRYDLLLSGVTPTLMAKIREMLSCK